MKYAIVLVLLFTITASAQKASPKADSARTVIAPTPFTHADTVRALHNLFKSRRNIGRWFTGSSAGIIAIAGLGTLADNNGQGNGGYFNPDAGTMSLLFGIALSPFWIPGTITLFKFTKKKEQFAIAEFERTGKTTHNLRRKLSRRFFNSNYRFYNSN
ncbi:MAG: hypothetical protein JWP58_1558 [Hymenobacter sp.]|nr:hypothetical protein [Hymenobacter sp.]